MNRIWTAALMLTACSGAGPGADAPPATDPAAMPPATEPAATKPAAQEEPTSQPASPQAAAQEQADGYAASEPKPGPEGSAVYGAALDPAVEQIALAQLLSAPDGYADRDVRVEGRVSRVCQQMGCWIELEDEAGGQQLRAPLAGHSYFLPQSAIGKRAIVQGKVSVRPLTAAQKAHLEAEGARATTAKVSIVASAVALKAGG